jgi:hypothetical protein
MQLFFQSSFGSAMNAAIFPVVVFSMMLSMSRAQATSQDG